MNAHARSMPRVFEPHNVDQRALRDAFSQFATGVTVVTAPSALGPVAMTATSTIAWKA